MLKTFQAFLQPGVESWMCARDLKCVRDVQILRSIQHPTKSILIQCTEETKIRILSKGFIWCAGIEEWRPAELRLVKDQ